MMSGRGKLVTGPILIVIGILLLIGHAIQWNAFSLLWLVLFLAVGLVLLVLYSRGRRQASVLSGGVLVTLLALHFFMLRLGWVNFGASWPFLLLAPGLALLAVAASDRQNKDALGPAITLISIAVICYLFTLGILAGLVRLLLGILRFLVRYLLPLGLIVWGVMMLIERQPEKRGEEEASPATVPPAPGGMDDAEVAEYTDPMEPQDTQERHVEEPDAHDEPKPFSNPEGGEDEESGESYRGD
jgi:hypothetical protein